MCTLHAFKLLATYFMYNQYGFFNDFIDYRQHLNNATKLSTK